MSLSLLLAAGSVAAIAAVGYRDHRAALTARRRLLDDCAGALDRAHLSFAADGFPRLEGSHRGRGVRIDLVPDTMTIRRLPQLWLSTTMLDANAGLPGLAVLVRPAGTEFYSLTSRLPLRLDAPRGFPDEVLIRGDAGAERLLADLAGPMSAILADGRVKEIAITGRGLRIVRQAAEGKRGEHLLLRQTVFESGAVPHRDLATIFDQLQAMRTVTSTYDRTHAA